MLSDNTLSIWKEKDVTVFVDTATLGIYTAEDMEPMFGAETKKREVNDWLDEHGEDAYDSDVTYLDAFDIGIPMLSVGNTPKESISNINTLETFLRSNGSLHKVYSPIFGHGRQKVRFLGTSDYKTGIQGEGEIVTEFKLKMRVGDPITLLTAEQLPGAPSGGGTGGSDSGGTGTGGTGTRPPEHVRDPEADEEGVTKEQFNNLEARVKNIEDKMLNEYADIKDFDFEWN